MKVDLTLLPPEKDVLNSKPGFASIVREYDPSSTWSLTNELPDRTSRYNAVPGVTDFGVWGVFSVKRPICKAIKPKPRFYLTFKGAVGKGCALLLGYFNSEPAQSVVLAPGQETSGGFTVFGRVRHWYLANVPEGIVDAAVTDLAAGPDATAVLLENALNPTGWQTPFLDGFDDSACLVESTGGIGGTTLLLFGYVGTSGVVAAQERCG
ncbi:MAG TPA: hypothetical protein VNA20_16305 [Frankiaceae bacterium]|nr:hypothetical protein [Frankiaceae bacterium]